jgi:hypothetical protein
VGEHRRPPWNEDEVVSAVRLGFILGAFWSALVGTAVICYPSAWSALPGLGALLVFAIGWGVLRNGGPGAPSSRA